MKKLCLESGDVQAGDSGPSDWSKYYLRGQDSGLQGRQELLGDSDEVFHKVALFLRRLCPVTEFVQKLLTFATWQTYFQLFSNDLLSFGM